MDSSQLAATQDSKNARSGSTDEDSGGEDDSEEEVASSLLTPNKQSQKRSSTTPREADEVEGDSTMKDKEVTPTRQSTPRGPKRFIPGIEAPTPERSPEKEQSTEPVEQEQEEEEEEDSRPPKFAPSKRTTRSNARKNLAYVDVPPVSATLSPRAKKTYGNGKARETEKQKLFLAQVEEDENETDYEDQPHMQASKKSSAKGKGKEVNQETAEGGDKDQTTSGANGANGANGADGSRGPVVSPSSKGRKKVQKKIVKVNPKWKSKETVDTEDDQDADDEALQAAIEETTKEVRPPPKGGGGGDETAGDVHQKKNGNVVEKGQPRMPSPAPSNHSDNQSDQDEQGEIQDSDQDRQGSNEKDDESYSPTRKRRKSVSKSRSKSRSRPAQHTARSPSPLPHPDSSPRKKPRIRRRRSSPEERGPNPLTTPAAQAAANPFNNRKPSGDEQPSSEDENPDRPLNPNREASFTRFSKTRGKTRGKFVPDQIWLHSFDGSPILYQPDSDLMRKKEIESLGKTYRREDIKELVERNGGNVVDEIADAKIVVLPHGMFSVEIYKVIYDEALRLGKDIVQLSWILESISCQTHDVPAFRSNPHYAAHVPAAPKPPAPPPDSYPIKNDEEVYWKKLARACEKGWDRNGDGTDRFKEKKSSMFTKMQERFFSKYRRTRSDYRDMYPRFLERLKERKLRSKYRASRQKKINLDDIELWTSDTVYSESENEDDRRSGSGSGKKRRRGREEFEIHVDEDVEEREEQLAVKPVKKKKRKSSLFTPKVPKARQEEEKRLAMETREEEERAEIARREEEDDSFDPSNPDREVTTSLEKSYPRFDHIVGSVFFYSNFNVTRSRRILDDITKLKTYQKGPSRDDIKAGELAAEIKRALFSVDEDNVLLKISEPVDADLVMNSPDWKLLRYDRNRLERELWRRYEILKAPGRPWSPDKGEEGTKYRHSEWKRLSEELSG